MADEKLKAGAELLEYGEEMNQVIGKLVEAAEKMAEIENLLAESYIGEAAEEMQMFAKNLKEHIEKLTLFYGKGMQFLFHTYQSLYESDEAMALWLLGRIQR